MRKENQVISAEEKRGILKMQGEEKAKRESMIVSNFREMGESTLFFSFPSLCSFHIFHGTDESLYFSVSSSFRSPRARSC